MRQPSVAVIVQMPDGVPLSAGPISVSGDDLQIVAVTREDRVAEASLSDRICLVTETNPSRACAYNAGAAVGDTDYLLFLNQTMEISHSSLLALTGHARYRPYAGATGGRLISGHHQTVSQIGYAFGPDRMPYPLYRGVRTDHPAVGRSRPLQAVSWDCMLVRRAAFQEVQGFDISLGETHVDVDFCLRLGEAGWGIHYCSEAVAVYGAPMKMGPLQSSDHAAAETAFRQRWFDRLRLDEFQHYWEDGLMRFEQHMLYPLELEIFPPLARAEDGADHELMVDMLRDQSRQMLHMVKENIRMRTWCKTVGEECSGATGEVG
jgi:GT2 family glycosyltransferase